MHLYRFSLLMLQNLCSKRKTCDKHNPYIKAYLNGRLFLFQKRDLVITTHRLLNLKNIIKYKKKYYDINSATYRYIKGISSIRLCLIISVYYISLTKNFVPKDYLSEQNLKWPKNIRCALNYISFRPKISHFSENKLNIWSTTYRFSDNNRYIYL